MPKLTDGEILNALNRNLPSEALIGEAAVAVMRIINAAWAERESGDDQEEYNREQRLRREGYADALAPKHLNPIGRKMAAAKRYPLRKRVPKPPIPDPHGKGEWCLVKPADRFYPAWRENGGRWVISEEDGVIPPRLDGERIFSLAELLKDPWSVEEDTSVEEETDG